MQFNLVLNSVPLYKLVMLMLSSPDFSLERGAVEGEVEASSGVLSPSLGRLHLEGRCVPRRLGRDRHFSLRVRLKI